MLQRRRHTAREALDSALAQTLDERTWPSATRECDGMTKMRRWRLIERNEKERWSNVAAGESGGFLASVDVHLWRANRLQDRLVNLGYLDVVEGGGSLLEVGSGPVGLLPFLSGRQRVSVDPLEQFYGADDRFRVLRNSDVRYLNGTAESLPVEDDVHDLVICENFLDRVGRPRAALAELRRVLRPAGILYLTASARTGWGHAVHRALAGIGIDPGTHRPTTPARARGLVEHAGFEVIHFGQGSFRGARTRDLRSGEPGLIARAVLGLSEVVMTIFAVKRAPMESS